MSLRRLHSACQPFGVHCFGKIFNLSICVYVYVKWLGFDFFNRMGTRVFIGRLSHSARDRDVERFFKGYGKIMEIVLKTGFGFVVGGKYDQCAEFYIELISRCYINICWIVEFEDLNVLKSSQLWVWDSVALCSVKLPLLK